eukprot:g8573.t1
MPTGGVERSARVESFSDDVEELQNKSVESHIKWETCQEPFFFVSNGKVLHAHKKNQVDVAGPGDFESSKTPASRGGGSLLAVWAKPLVLRLFDYEMRDKLLGEYSLEHLMKAYDCRFKTMALDKEQDMSGDETSDESEDERSRDSVMLEETTEHIYSPLASRDPGRVSYDNEGVLLGVSPGGRYVLLRLDLRKELLVQVRRK